MKMIAAGAATANQYSSFVHDCTRNAACDPSWAAPIPSLSALQLYADFGTVNPGTVEFTIVECTGDTEQVIPAEYVIGQTPDLTYYGVFRNFSSPVAAMKKFVIFLSIDGSTNFFSQMLYIEDCVPLMKIKSCHPQGATTTAFDVNGVYYGLSQGSVQGDAAVRYFHIAYVRSGKVRELSNRAVFKSSLYTNFRTTVEKIYQSQSEIVPQWYKDILLAVFSRGAVSFDDGRVYLVADLAFEPLNDDDLIWKAWAQLKDTNRLYYGCDDGLCEECCSPSITSATATEGEPDCCDPVVLSAEAETTIPDDGSGSGGSVSDSGSGSVSDSASDSASGSGSEPEPEALRLIFTSDQSGNDLAFWNTLFNTAINADTPFSSVVYSGGGTIVDLFGHTNLELADGPMFVDNWEIVEFLDFSEEVFESSGAFVNAISLTTVLMPACTQLNANNFQGCLSLVSVTLPIVTFVSSGNFENCVSLVSISLPACTTFGGGSVFAFCSAIQNIDLPVLTIINGFDFRQIGDGVNPITIYTPLAIYGPTTGDDNIFFFTSGQTIEITLPTSEVTDGDIVAVQAANTVTLIPV